MLAFEAYDARADLYDTHFHSKAMHDFLPKIKKTMTTGLDLTHYEDVGGFLDKADMRECGIIYDTRIKSARGKRDEVLNRFKTLSQWVEKNESGTYTFLVLKSLDNDSGVRIFERYENKSALVEHMSGQKLLETFMDSKEIIASMEGRGYSPCGFGWLHR